MKSLLLSVAALGALTLASCSPSGPVGREDRGIRVYSMPESWGSGGHYTGFAPSSPSANGNASGHC